MKQVLQDLNSGRAELVDAPPPQGRAGHLLIDATVSLISTGTERMLVDFGRAGLISKARQQPEKVKEVLAKARTDGLMTTVDAVKSKLAQPIPLGYCHVGRVREVGAGVEGYRPGDRVISNGSHADVVSAPKNLTARIPDNVSDEEAAFTVAASIGLQGIRLAQPTLGECVVVTGAGLIGLLTVQLLLAQGCRVLAIDLDPAKLDLARRFGAETCNPALGEDPVAAGMKFSRGRGVDAVIITASTKSSDPVAQAARMSRKRGHILLVGVAGLELNRADFYEKELSFQVSCSYGPGRYDPAYEAGGSDYPLGFVRWTEQRNFEAVLDMMAGGRLDVAPLVTHRYSFVDAPSAYDTLSNDKSALGIILTYDHPVEPRHQRTVDLAPVQEASAAGAGSRPVVGVIGAGNYASRVLIPAFRAAGATLDTVASAGGVSGVVSGRRSGFSKATSDTASLIADPRINTVAIVTRHNTHARLVVECLQADKNVFVEKPLALTSEELGQVEAAHAAHRRQLMVGFNRRFAPHVQTIKRLLEAVQEPKAFVMVMNAGAMPLSHWAQSPEIGGGRIIGEACHYIDLMRHLAGAEIVSLSAQGMRAADPAGDKASITLGFADGSFGTVHYLANGSSAFPKERVEIFVAGRILQLDNFIRLRGFGWPGFRKQTLMRQDKGQEACVAAFLKAVETGAEPPIPANELFEVARVTIEAAEQLRSH